MTELHRLSTDFNERTREGELMAFLRSTLADTPKIGQRVLLVDGEGNRCEGDVTGIEGTLARIRADFSTWQDGDA